MDASEYIGTGRIGKAIADRINRRSGTSYPVERFTFRIGPTATEPAVFTYFRGAQDACDAITIDMLHLYLGEQLSPAEAAILAEYAREGS